MMLGRFVPAPVWESKPVRSVRRPFALAVGAWRIWVGAWRIWSERRGEWRRFILQAREDSERLLREHSGRLAEGEWRLHIVSKKVPMPYRRLQKPVQAFLVREGSASVPDALRACGFGSAKYDVWRGGWSGSVDIAASGPRNGFRPAIVLPRHSGKDLYFDLESRTVLRVSRQGFTEEYELLRRRFSAHVPSVAFEVLPGRDGIVEPFVEGRPLSQVDVDVMVRSVARLLDGLSEVAREFGESDSAEHVTAAIDGSDPTLGARRVRGGVIEWLGAAPKVPAHGDLSAPNVIVTAQGPVCIDFGATSIQPAWFDGLQLAFEAVRRLEASGEGRSGALDQLLRDFLRRTIPAPLPDDWRRLAALGFQAMFEAIRNISVPRMIPSPAWVGQRD